VTPRSPEETTAQAGRTVDPLAAWVKQIQAGIDVNANFARLHQRLHPKVYFYFFEKRCPPALCEELTQEVFLRVFKSISTFEGRSRVATWVLQIAHNLWANEVRSDKTEKRDGFEVPLEEESDPESEEEGRTASALVDEGLGPEEELWRKEQSAALWKAVDDDLPPQMRRCVYLRLREGRPYHEIAEILGVSIDTVKAQLGQAKKRLQGLLGDRKLT
jgi:RNA polymerase sigma-70 factor (ECF subfamily)